MVLVSLILFLARRRLTKPVCRFNLIPDPAHFPQKRVSRVLTGPGIRETVETTLWHTVVYVHIYIFICISIYIYLGNRLKSIKWYVHIYTFLYSNSFINAPKARKFWYVHIYIFWRFQKSTLNVCPYIYIYMDIHHCMWIGSSQHWFKWRFP